MPIHAIQPTFAGGEFTPTLHSRVDISRYPSGLRRAKNCIIHPHGGCSNRPGTEYIAETQNSDKQSKLVDFIFSTEQAYILEFGDGYIRFYKDGAQILKSSPSAWTTSHGYVVGDFVTQSSTSYYCIVAHTSGTFAADLAAGKWRAQEVYEIPTDFTEDEVASLDIKKAQSADVLYIAHPDHAPQTLTRSAHDNWTLADYDYEGGPFMVSNEDESNTITVTVPQWATSTGYVVGDYVMQGGSTYQCVTAHTSGTFNTDIGAGKWVKSGGIVGGTHITLTAIDDTFDTLHVGALWRHTVALGNQENQVTLSSAGDKSAPMPCGTTWRWYSTGSWSGFVTLERSDDAGKTWTGLRTFKANADTFGDTGKDQCLIRVRAPDNSIGIPENPQPPNFSGSIVVTISSDPFSWFGIARITAKTSAKIVTATSEEFLVYNTASFDWAEGSWSDYRGFPSAVTFNQDRLAWANTYGEPNTTWLSQSGAYKNFKRSSPLVDSDAISTPLPTQKVNAIRNLIPLGDLLALTSADDWIITSTGGILTPTTILARPQGFRGCSKLQPVIVGNRIIAMQPKGQVVRDIAFNQYDSTALQSDDNISIMSAHLFQGKEIVGMAYAQEPDSIVWFVRDDGILLSLTYLREQEVLAWTWHDTNGEFESVATIPGDGHDEVWVIVKRSINGTTKRFVERFKRRLATTETQDQFFLDCGLSYNGAAAQVITGLSHLNGEEVVVLADGNVVRGLTVSGGQITLPFEAHVVHVGLPYTMEMETLNLEIPQRDGTMQGRKSKISEVVVRFVDSLGGKLGPSDGYEMDPIVQRPNDGIQQYNAPTALQSGQAIVSHSGGWEDGARVLVTQEEPLPLTVIAVIPRVNPGG